MIQHFLSTLLVNLSVLISAFIQISKTMKKLAILLLLALGLGCKKESADPQTSGISGKKIISLTVSNKPSITFEFDKDLLVKENAYTFCETNPTDEFTYEYANGRISKLKTTLRSMYSSTTALCNPASGMKSEETFEYNGKGQLSRIVRVNTTTEFIYNTEGRVEQQIDKSDGKNITTRFEYDTRGNITKVTNGDREVTVYEYDNKINPYYLIRQRPQWISAFNKSPNNVIKATGRYSFQRIFKYDTEGYPTEVLEDNGLTYKYNYE